MRRQSTPSPHLGLVCITHGPEIRFKTITKTRLLIQSESERVAALTRVYGENVKCLARVPSFCRDRGIQLYRLSSSLFPFLDIPEGREVMKKFKRDLSQIGESFAKMGIRIVTHPDPFVVLNSVSTNVVANSRLILETQAKVLDLLKQPRSNWALIEIHGGKSGRAQELVEEIGRLDENVRSRIGIENDEYAFSADEVLQICQKSKVPMVFDAHHHVVHEKLAGFDHPSIAEFTEAARETWSPSEWQLVHISNGRVGHLDRHHSDMITVMPEAFSQVPWIEIEAKNKELAIDWLNEHWQKSKKTH